MEETNVIIIGIGPHARRIYVPVMYRFAEKMKTKLVLGVELESQQSVIHRYLKSKGYDLPVKYIQPFDNSELPVELDKYLSDFVRNNDVKGVIISTEPLYHKCYALWALRNGLNILMDKPITAHSNVTWDQNKIDSIGDDYDDILTEYFKLQQTKETIFTVNTQRRYHLGYQKVCSLIKEVAEKLNAPVTSIQSAHSDGQWFMPEEISSRKYHPLNQGYGKCFHSGYHLTDIIYQFYAAGKRPGKFADKAETYSSFIQPRGFLKQFTEADYHQFFGKAYDEYSKKTHEQYFNEFENFGELDAFSVIRLTKDNEAIANISLNLLHNSFSRRSWLEQDKDLYKGNGRVKHEYHHIQQGPFQCVQIHNYQANDKHDTNTDADINVGGNNHFDILVFRNVDFFEKGEKAINGYRASDLAGVKQDNARLFHEWSKDFVVIEFLQFIKGEIKLSDAKSNIDTHKVPVRLLQSLYQSNKNRIDGTSPIAKFTFD